MSKHSVVLVYDGMCPLCTRYAQATRIREQFGSLELVDARCGSLLVAELMRKGYDLNDGMVLMLEGEIYHGAKALEVVASISGRVGWFNRLNYFIFRHHLLAKYSYPILRAGRNALLFLLGRGRIQQQQP